MSVLPRFLRLGLSSIVAFGSLAGLLQAAPAEQDVLPAAREAALAWLAQIDRQAYEQAYSNGCEGFQREVSTLKWVEVLKTIRKPLGVPKARQETAHEYQPHGVKGLSGVCFSFSYSTTFPTVLYEESVTVRLEDGRWLGAGYQVRPPRSTEDESEPIPSPTESSSRVQKLGPPSAK